MATSKGLFPANKLYKFIKPNLMAKEGGNLPEAYKAFYREWKMKPAPVHYIPPTVKWVRNDETGEVKRIQDVPIPVLYPPESHKGIWGGEGIIKGYQKRQRLSARVPHFWFPHLKKSAVYSEILNTRMEVTLTERTIEKIFEHFGFDHYILKTRACDLQSTLALKLKREMLLALFHKSLYPDDPVKRDEVYNKYKHYLEPFTEEAIDWYGLTFDEALRKQRQIEAEANKKSPLKHEFRKAYIQYLIDAKSAPPSEEEEEPKSWVHKLNPFSKTK